MADYARGERMKDLREAQHLTQADAAHELGVSEKTVRNWEHGKGIKWEKAKEAAKLYGVDPESLVSRELPEAADPDQLGRLEAKLDLLISGQQRLEERQAYFFSLVEAARFAEDDGTQDRVSAESPAEPTSASTGKSRSARR